jgi:hypothetical protein
MRRFPSVITIPCELGKLMRGKLSDSGHEGEFIVRPYHISEHYNTYATLKNVNGMKSKAFSQLKFFADRNCITRVGGTTFASFVILAQFFYRRY